MFQAEYSKKCDTWEKFDEEQRFFFFLMFEDLSIIIVSEVSEDKDK